METQTSTTNESIEYGIFINPSTYCRVINIQSQEELYLMPGIQYHLPWNKEDVKIVDVIREEVATTGIYCPPSFKDRESFNWLKLAESAFNFWDSEEDDIWNNV